MLREVRLTQALRLSCLENELCTILGYLKWSKVAIVTPKSLSIWFEGNPLRQKRGFSDRARFIRTSRLKHHIQDLCCWGCCQLLSTLRLNINFYRQNRGPSKDIAIIPVLLNGEIYCLFRLVLINQYRDSLVFSTHKSIQIQLPSTRLPPRRRK